MAYLVRLFYKFVNFLFGNTKIFIFILGWFLVITGIIFFLNPVRARAKLLRQGFVFFKWQLFFAAFYLAMLLLSLGGQTRNVLAQVSAIVGVIVIFKLFFSLKTKAYNKLSEHLARVPIKYLKIFASIQIAVGGLMLFLQRRI